MKTQYLPTIPCDHNASIWSATKTSSRTSPSMWIPEAASAVETKVGRPCGANKPLYKTANRDNVIGKAEKRPGYQALHFARHLTRSLVLQGQCDPQEQLGRNLPALRSSTVPPEVRLSKGTTATMLLNEDLELRSLPSTATKHINQVLETRNDSDYRYDTSTHSDDQFGGLKDGLVASAQCLELSTGRIPCWAARLPFVHPLHQLIQRGCLGIQYAHHKPSISGGMRGSTSKAKPDISNEVSVPHPTLHSAEEDNKSSCQLKCSQSMSSSSLSGCQGSSNKPSSQESLPSAKMLHVKRQEQQKFRNTKKPRPGVDPETAVTVGRMTLEKRRPSMHKAVQQQYRSPTGRGMASLKVHRQRYPDPVAGCSKQFARRIAELARAETETIHWEMTRKNKKKTVAG